MPTNYIANDPQSSQPDTRTIAPHANRPAGVAGFDFSGAVPEDVYDVGSAEFLYWQCREAALRTLDAWEALDGPLANWFNNQSTIDLIQKGPGNVPNAFYNRQSLQFFEYTTSVQSHHSGASTDVVAHEIGHGFLDAMRPDILVSTLFESDAFHEAFGDCVALLTALADEQVRRQLLDATTDLRAANFVEATAEDLSEAIRQGIADGALSNQLRNAELPRRAHNTFQWTPFFNLPQSGDAGVLIGEIHSFGQVFSGCFWDVIANIFAGLPGNDQAALETATQTAGRLLIAGAREAPLNSQFFREVGRAMVMADRRDNGGADVTAIQQAFDGHSIDLDIDAMLAPTAALSGRAPALAAAAPSAILTRASRRDIVGMVGEATGQKFFVKPAQIGETLVAMARHRHYVALDDVSELLAGVEAPVEEDILVGESNGRAAILGAAPTISETRVEVLRYVNTLLMNDCIEHKEGATDTTTHRIEQAGSRRVLRRYRYACRHH